MKPETEEEAKEGNEEDHKEAKGSVFAREEKRALKELSQAAAHLDQNEDEGSSELEVKHLLGLAGPAG